jgi:23S rRNA pseudouridine2605 synthase
MDSSPNKKRLSKVLAVAGIASRRGCEELIFAGKVAVNGAVTLVPQTMVDGKKDKITVNGEEVGTAEPKVYYVLNKPIGYICSAKKTNRTKIVLELFQDTPLRLFTVGRLDKDTQGLLIVTNDGHFANEVIHPSRNIHKEYLVKTDQEITAEHLMAITNGALVEGVFLKPVRVTKVRKGTIKVVIAEGKKREVRHLLAAAGLKVQELTRIRIGGLHLGALKPGAWRVLSEKERKVIFE